MPQDGKGRARGLIPQAHAKKQTTDRLQPVTALACRLGHPSRMTKWRHHEDHTPRRDAHSRKDLPSKIKVGHDNVSNQGARAGLHEAVNPPANGAAAGFRSLGARTPTQATPPSEPNAMRHARSGTKTTRRPYHHGSVARCPVGACDVYGKSACTRAMTP